jgi:hypothetical protein
MGFDLNRLFVSTECPACSYALDVQLIDVRLQRIIFCPNCKASVQLVDHEASMAGAHRKIENEINRILGGLA